MEKRHWKEEKKKMTKPLAIARLRSRRAPPGKLEWTGARRRLARAELPFDKGFKGR